MDKHILFPNPSLELNLLLRAKLAKPALQKDALLRPRLTRQLDHSLNVSLTLVTGPAGFGKTTLLAQWLATRPEAVGWLTLDSSDNDPTRFLRYLSAALENSYPKVLLTFNALLASLPPPPLETLLTVFIDEVSQLEKQTILILDGYEKIENDQIHKLVNFLLEYLPAHLHIVISSRIIPPLSLASLRVKDKLQELDVQDLKFSQQETTKYLAELYQLSLTPSSLEKLQNTIGGWPAALHLITFSLQNHANASAYIEEISGNERHIADYLTQEVLQRQPLLTQQFLLQTSILHTLSAGLCEAVTGLPEAVKILEDLAKNNIFIAVLDEKRACYKYLSIFADFLRTQLYLTQPGLVKQLHRRAWTWLKANSLVGQAIEHAIEAEEYDVAVQFISEDASRLLACGEVITILNQLQKLPPILVEKNIRLKLYRAWVFLFTRQLKAATEQIYQIETTLRISAAHDTDSGTDTNTTTTDAFIFWSESKLIQAAVAALERELDLSIQLASQALKGLPKDNYFLQSVAFWTLAYSYHMSGILPEAEASYRSAISAAQHIGNITLTLLALAGLGYTLGLQGKVAESVIIYKQAIELGFGNNSKFVWPMTAISIINLAEVYYEWNELESAEQYIEQASGLYHPDFLDIFVENQLVLAKIGWAKHNPTKALETICKLNQLLLDNGDKNYVAYVKAWSAQFSLWAGDIAAAISWTEQVGLPLAHTPAFLEQQAYLTFGRVLLAKGQYNEALQIAENVFKGAKQANWRRSVVNSLLLQAQIYSELKNVPKMLEKIEQALLADTTQQFVRLFLNEGEQVYKLLQSLERANPATSVLAYLQKLQNHFENERKIISREKESLRRQELEQTEKETGADEVALSLLSPRELEVLQLLVKGYTNKEIATRLIIAVTTVKTHVEKIYTKLDVINRAQAITKARDLNLAC